MSAPTATTTTYAADLVAIIVAGPVDFVDSIFFSNCQAFGPSRVNRSGRDYVDIVVSGSASSRFYFGTPTQTPDPLLTNDPAQAVHPSYKHQSYLRLQQFSLGNSPAAPTGQLILGRFPVVSWIGDNNRIGDDANPAHLVAEMLTSPRFGLGLSQDKMHATSFIAAAARFVMAAYGLSVYLQRQQPVHQVITEICEYFGGILRDNAGRAELFVPQHPADLNTVPLLTADHYVEEPTFTFGSWAETVNQVNATYSEPQIFLQAAVWTAMNDANIATVGEQRLLSIERRWLTTQDNVKRYAEAMLAVKSRPVARLACRVLAGIVDGLLPGDPVRATVPDTGEVLLMRINQITEETAGAQSVTLELAQDYSEVIA
ncbi:MAG: phage tail protein [Verrucomicrobia bacterium]|nr:phage tail protein [Verrucomicrobiota bacterium]